MSKDLRKLIGIAEQKYIEADMALQEVYEHYSMALILLFPCVTERN